MSDFDFTFDDLCEPERDNADTQLLRSQLKDRCETASIPYEEIDGMTDDDIACRISLPCARERRWIDCLRHSDYEELLSIAFEKLVFLNGLDAICNYSSKSIEAKVRPITNLTSMRMVISRLSLLSPSADNESPESLCIEMTSPSDPAIKIRLAQSTPELRALVGGPNGPYPWSLHITGPGITSHDNAIDILRRVADAIFFQIDLITDMPLSLARAKRMQLPRKPRRRPSTIGSSLEFPKNAYETAPVSLYWYARSAIGMPLLQFLAYYQVIEYYYPVYSKVEAHRKLKTILKNPTFRSDRDSDITRLLNAIHVSRSGTYGDERSQLKATLTECVDTGALQTFLNQDAERKSFLSSKTKGLTDRKLTIDSQGTDLRNDVAERLYEIRCKVVHTKPDSHAGELDLLLPFSKEAEQLYYDIELAQFLAQQVLIASSTPLSI